MRSRAFRLNILHDLVEGPLAAILRLQLNESRVLIHGLQSQLLIAVLRLCKFVHVAVVVVRLVRLDVAAQLLDWGDLFHLLD